MYNYYVSNKTSNKNIFKKKKIAMVRVQSGKLKPCSYFNYREFNGKVGPHLGWKDTDTKTGQ
jgi:hypothetical protein